MAANQNSNHRKNNITLVFQNYNLIDYLTPIENVRLVNKKASEDILLKLGLDESQINRNVMKFTYRYDLLPTVVINLIVTFAIPNISVIAHVGGLIIGIISGLILCRKVILK